MTKLLPEDKARELFETGAYTFVAVDASNKVLVSSEKGVKPLTNLLDGGVSLDGFSACDKIVGRAASFLYILLSVDSLYAETLSLQGKELLERYGIAVSYKILCDEIISRDGTDICPMDKAVLGVDDPIVAYDCIKKKQQELGIVSDKRV